MAYQALYRTYRPMTFEEVVGQKYAVRALRNAVQQDKIAHAYLFCGPRGTGKTTIARLLAKAINCKDHENAPCGKCESCTTIQNGTNPDIIEIDAASYNGVDATRELVEKVKYAPLQSKYKVYIIDEVHMLSKDAFNALLKTLEEPPEHAVFILATTEPLKVLPTIISRCQRYDFESIDTKEIYQRLTLVLKTENIKYEEEAIHVISELADGGMRDALSILDQVIAYSTDIVKTEDVYEVYGIATPQSKYELIQSILDGNTEIMLDLSEKMTDSGIDARRLSSDLVEILKETVIYAYTDNKKYLKNISSENAKNLLSKKNPQSLLDMVEILMNAINSYRFTSNIHSTFEVALLKMVGVKNTETVLVSRQKEIVEHKDFIKSESVSVSEKESVLKTEENSLNTEVELTKGQNFDLEYCLRLLVGADKNQRTKLTSDWENLAEYEFSTDYAKFARNLRGVSILAAGENYAIVVEPYSSAADMINENANNKELQEMMKKVTGETLQLIAITKEQSNELIAEFRNRQAQGNLPEKIAINAKKETPIKENKESVEDKVLNFFGAENIEIQGE